ncbi:hypothetical protein KEM52_000791 [Ascosphaera acerosa]|nr:hypothetical protein KEM52_000791 [Ascosphaera acerosa]
MRAEELMADSGIVFQNEPSHRRDRRVAGFRPYHLTSDAAQTRRRRPLSVDSDEARLFSDTGRLTRDPDAVPLSKPSPSARPKPGAAYHFRPTDRLSSTKSTREGVSSPQAGRSEATGVEIPIRRQQPQYRVEEETRAAKRRRLQHDKAAGPGISVSIPVAKYRPTLPRADARPASAFSTALMTPELNHVEQIATGFKQRSNKRGRLSRSPSIPLFPSVLSPARPQLQELHHVSVTSQLPAWAVIASQPRTSRRTSEQHGQPAGHDKIVVRSPRSGSSEDELQGQHVTVSAPPAEREQPRAQPQNYSADQHEPFLGDVFVLNRSVCKGVSRTHPHMMTIDWQSQRASIEPPESSHSHPIRLHLDNVHTVYYADNIDSRTIGLKLRKGGSEPEGSAVFDFDTRDACGKFLAGLLNHCAADKVVARSSEWITKFIQRQRRQVVHEEKPTDADTTVPPPPATSLQNSANRPKLVQQLQANMLQDDGRTTRATPPPGTHDPYAVPVKKYIAKAPSSPPQRETRSMTAQKRPDAEAQSSSRPSSRSRSQSPIIDAPPDWSRPLVFPRTGKKRAEVEAQDMTRLRKDDFLNDNLIGLFTRYLEYYFEQAQPGCGRKVYFFNSYFYDRLMDRPKGQRTINYDGVAKWTRNTDLFSYDYAVVPINENAHWYLAIMCNLPSLLHKPEEESQDTTAQPTPTSSQQQQQPQQQGGDDNLESSMQAVSLTDKTTDSPHKHRSKKQTKPHNPGRTYRPDQPVIITFDSLGYPRSLTVRALKDYLVAEAKAKRGLAIDEKRLSGMTAKAIPLQGNYSDCGLYLLAYLERFSNNPEEFVSKLLQKEMDLERDWPALDSRELRERLRDFLLALHAEQARPDPEGQQPHRVKTPLHILLPPTTDISGEKADACTTSTETAGETGPAVTPGEADAEDSAIAASANKASAGDAQASVTETSKSPATDGANDLTIAPVDTPEEQADKGHD